MAYKSRFVWRTAIGSAVLLCLFATLAAIAQQGSLVATSSSAPASDATKNMGPMQPSPGIQSGVDQSYRIGVDDELTISVWREADLSGQVQVRPDGVITLPLLNDVNVVGLSTKQLQDMLAEKLKAYVAEPQVTVIVRAIRSRKVYLMGEVSRPGVYPLGGTTTALQLFAAAGGVNPFAKVKNIYIIRQQNGQHTRIPFNYKRAIVDASSKYDVVLQPGDMIVVP